MIAVGVGLAVLAAVLGTTSKQLIAAAEHYRKDCLFHLGVGLNVAVGPVVDAAAYACAPQVVVAPLACLDVIINALTAPRVLHWQGERLTRAHFVGVVLVTLGAVGTSIFAAAEDRAWTVYELEDQLFWRFQSVAYLVLEVVFICTVLTLLRNKKRLKPAARGLLLGGAAGAMMGNVFFAKGLLAILGRTFSTGSFDAWRRLTPYVLILAALSGPLGGHILMRKGLAEYKGVFMVTIFQGSHIAAACLSGCVVMGEMANATWWQFLLYWGAVCLIFAGLMAINTTATDACLYHTDSGPIVPGGVPQAAMRRALSRRKSSGSSSLLGSFVGATATFCCAAAPGRPPPRSPGAKLAELQDLSAFRGPVEFPGRPARRASARDGPGSAQVSSWLPLLGGVAMGAGAGALPVRMPRR